MSEFLGWQILALNVALACFVFSSSIPSTPSNEQSQHWKNDCTLIETNIDNGIFSPSQNRLQCGEVIENVSAKEYDRVMGRDKSEGGYKTLGEFFEDILKSSEGDK